MFYLLDGHKFVVAVTDAYNMHSSGVQIGDTVYCGFKESDVVQLETAEQVVPQFYKLVDGVLVYTEERKVVEPVEDPVQ